jgi:predicted nucleotidyltransferase
MVDINAHGLSGVVVGRILNVLRHYPQIEEAVLYGSRAKGNYRAGSDIDLTLRGHEIDLKLMNRISNELDDLLLPYSFDLSMFDQIENEELLDHIARVGVVFYCKDCDGE